jgi:hypothetical protein
MYTDTISLPGIDARITVDNGYVGAIYKDHLRNPTQPRVLDGIIGVAYPSVSSSGAKTIIDNLYENGIIKTNAFSICMKKDVGGVLYLGSNNAVDSGVSIMWTPIVKDTYYVVKLLDFRVNNQSIGVDPSVYNRGDAIVDSGSTSLTLPRTAFDAFRDTMLNSCSNNETQLIGVCVDSEGRKIEPGRGIFEGLCYEMGEADVLKYPMLTVQLENNVDLVLKPNMYMRNGGVFCDDGLYTIGIDSGSVTGGTLLGDTFMSSFLTIFDRQNKNIGFVDRELAC